MASEKQMWTDHVRPFLQRLKADPIRVENGAEMGTPDVNFIEGWVELKHLHDWPKKGGTVAIDHFTPHQRTWLLRRWKARGNAWLLLRISRTYYLFDGYSASQQVGRVNAVQLCRIAAVSGDRLDADTFGFWLLNQPAVPAALELKRMRLRAMRFPEEVAHDLGWTVNDLLVTELGRGTIQQSTELHNYWLS